MEWQHDYTHVCLQSATQAKTPTAEPTPVSGEDTHTWLDRQITNQDNLHLEQIRLLSDLAACHPGIHPHSLLLPASAPRIRAFHRGLKALRQFHQREGHTHVPSGHRENLYGDEVLLGRWNAKCQADAAQLTAPQITALTALGIKPEPVFQEPAPLPGTSDTTYDDWWATGARTPPTGSASWRSGPKRADVFRVMRQQWPLPHDPDPEASGGLSTAPHASTAPRGLAWPIPGPGPRPTYAAGRRRRLFRVAAAGGRRNAATPRLRCPR
ncbi:hypothetical protein GTW60_01410 [Streptomyces sp. SID4937]|nr:hypothetical protein [Streptomyces sp. SID4937]